MIKRVRWFVSGMVAGAAGATVARRRVRATAAQLAPVQVARTAAAKAGATRRTIAAALHDGRGAMQAKEAELRARLLGGAESAGDGEAASAQTVDTAPMREGRDNEQVGPRRTSRRSRRST